MDEDQVVTHPEMSTACYSTGGWSLLCTRGDGTSKAPCMGTEPPRCQQDHHTLTDREAFRRRVNMDRLATKRGIMRLCNWSFIKNIWEADG